MRKSKLALKISVTSIFTALVAIATMMFSIYVPATRGYFNIGEAMVYTTALLFGPAIGAIAGGAGSMIADLSLGFPHYAPGTLIIKACEGAIVGFLSRKTLIIQSKIRWRFFTSCVGLILALLISYVGVIYYVGPVEASLGFPFTGYATIQLYIPIIFWIFLALIAAVSILYIGFKYEAEFGWLILAVLLGGLEMVLGYFLYEQILLGVAAIAEVPINLGQLTIGLIISIPLVKAVRKRLLFLKAFP
jgi:uncharacterized membrane protein